MTDLKHIAIAGNIGCGKTTLTRKLAKHYGWQAQFESVEDNPYLADFYGDMRRWSFHLQVYFLNSRFNQVQAIREMKQSIIQDRTIYEDAYIFAKNLQTSGLIEQRDYENYLRLFESMMTFVKPPDLLIYLKADIGKLVNQIEKRGRDYENKIQIDYLKNLNEHYEEWIGGYNIGPLLVVDVTQMDFEKRVEDFSSIVQKIDFQLNGLFSDL